MEDNKKYKVNRIQDSAVYAKESVIRQLPGLYYLVLWKDYFEEKNTWEPTLAIQHLQRLVTAYHKDNLEKPPATSAPVNTAPLMARPTARLMTALTKKCGQPAKFITTTNKRANKSQTFFLLNPSRFFS